MEKVLHAELTPQEFRKRIKEAPIAYLPLGTLEWHGEHLPLGADGIQAQGFFEQLARRVGGVVLPMLFMGPDRKLVEEDQELYGMDYCDLPKDHEQYYENGKRDGSIYWLSDEVFEALLDGIMKQLQRAGFKIVVAHGHGPSGNSFMAKAAKWKEKYGLECLNCWGSEWDEEGLGLQVDHAAMNETSLVMALRPELVHMENLPSNLEEWPVGIGGKDPRIHASREVGEKAIMLQLERMENILRNML